MNANSDQLRHITKCHNTATLQIYKLSAYLLYSNLLQEMRESSKYRYLNTSTKLTASATMTILTDTQ